jgi:protein-tyrosine phosphatase
MNFRDFGGYPTGDGQQVKRGRLFRSGSLAGLTEADHAALDALKIRLICDLRRDSERVSMPTRWAGEPAPEILHLPLLHEGDATTAADWRSSDPDALRDLMVRLYGRMASSPIVRGQFKTLFERLADSTSCPMLIHCSAGKDRTGVSCALILSALGVDRSAVIEDYLLTRIYYDSMKAWKSLSTQIVDANFGEGWTKEAADPVFSAEPAYIEALFAAIDAEYGSIEDFMTDGVGLSAATLNEVRAHLVE